MRVTKLDWTIIFFLSVSFCISNSHLFFVGVYSDAPMYAYLKGDVEWWVLNIAFMANMVWLTGFAIFLGLSKTRLNLKQASMIAVYGWSLYKDIYDWLHGNYTDTRYKDWIITVMLFAFVQFLFWTIKKFRNST